jgi:cell division protein FtsL
VKLIAIAMLAGLCAFASAVELVLNRHASRVLFVELQSLRDSRQQLDQEWGQLVLEQATWATPVRVEDLARESLSMIAPDRRQVIELQ